MLPSFPRPPRRPDEMARQIAGTAREHAYAFLLAALALWSLREAWQSFARRTGPNLLPGALLAGALLAETASRLFLTRRAVKDDEDSFETGPLRGLVLLACLVLGLGALAGAALLLLGVRP